MITPLNQDFLIERPGEGARMGLLLLFLLLLQVVFCFTSE